MNEIFEILHRGHSAFGVFAIDVAVFAGLMVVIYALIYLAVHKVGEILPHDPDEILLTTPIDIEEEYEEEDDTDDIDEICKIYK